MEPAGQRGDRGKKATATTHRRFFPSLCFRFVTYTNFNLLCIWEQVSHLVKDS